MKTNILILICLAIFAVGGFFTYQHIYSVQVIILKNEQAIITKESWVVGDSLFYRVGPETQAISRDQVFDVKHQGLINKGYGIWVIIKHHLAPWKHKSMDIVSQAQIEKRDIRKWAPTIGLVLTGLGLCLTLFFVLKKVVRLRKERNARSGDALGQAKDQRIYEGQELIVNYFLSVFRAQKGLPSATEAMFRAVDTRRPDGNSTYELRVKTGDDWASRRMTIGPIGEDSGSRSKCYYVIYDDHIVVKINPKPLVDFDRYVQSINRDNQTALILSPRECLVPRIAVILKKLIPHQVDSDLPIEDQEKQYIEWLVKNPEAQSHLKIGDGFAYFMDLSKYFFLGHILQRIHSIEDKMSDEILKHPNLLWSNVDFEARYGSQNAEICDQLNPVYTSFHTRIYDLLQQHHIDETVSDFNLKEWFLVYLSGSKPSTADLDAKRSVFSDMYATTMKLFNEQRAAVENYRRLIRSYVLARNLKQHSSAISSMVINLLDLLYWLGHKKLAMRDLKPDNLLVAGNPAKFPQFLGSANMFSIGLIDVETAVSYDTANPKDIRQPPLGGTPSHATPVHQLRNSTIQDVYKDLPLLLHLQDWYATAAMIYQVVTGERLFEKTAKHLIKLKKSIKERTRQEAGNASVLKEVSLSFWRVAQQEFDAKTAEHEKKLRYISQIMSPESNSMLLNKISATQKSVQKAVQRLVQSQKIFKGDKILKNLVSAPALKIRHLRIKLNDGKARQLAPEERQAAATFLNNLIYLKNQSEHLVLTSALLAKSVPAISGYDLLKAMFIVVQVQMCQRPFGIAKAKK